MAELLKNHYNKNLIHRLSGEIKQVYHQFNEKKFVQDIFDEFWEEKELKQRMRHISEGLRVNLPHDYRKALEILKPVSLNFSGLEHMFFPDFVELCGLDDFNASISAMEFFTELSSSEFPVRLFIIKYGKQMMKQMELWAESDNHHIRRLASEGCRPRLPWAIALPEFKKNPRPVLPILEKLKADESEYVRKSVANNLNDISKDNPDIVIKRGIKWLGDNNNTDWIVKHGCRTLLKNGNSEVLKFFDFRAPTYVKIQNFKISKTICMGGEVEFSFLLVTDKKKLGKLRIEYAIDFVRLNNKINRKVFKISEGDYAEKKRQILKRHSFRKISTRNYYVGNHGLTIIVNGKEMIKTSFVLKD